MNNPAKAALTPTQKLAEIQTFLREDHPDLCAKLAATMAHACTEYNIEWLNLEKLRNKRRGNAKRKISLAERRSERNLAYNRGCYNTLLTVLVRFIASSQAEDMLVGVTRGMMEKFGPNYEYSFGTILRRKTLRELASLK